ncbi:hypothetical protein CCP3SC15_300014 [Gammaproteobacteria bacterium]
MSIFQTFEENATEEEIKKKREEELAALAAIQMAQKDFTKRDTAISNLDDLAALDLTSAPGYRQFNIDTPEGQIGGRGKLLPHQERRLREETAGAPELMPPVVPRSKQFDTSGMEALASKDITDILNERGLTGQYSEDKRVQNFMKTVQGQEDTRTTSNQQTASAQQMRGLAGKLREKPEYSQLANVLEAIANSGDISKYENLLKNIGSGAEGEVANKQKGDLSTQGFNQNVDLSKQEYSQDLDLLKKRGEQNAALLAQRDKMDKENPKTNFSQEQQLRSQFDTLAKDFITIRDSYRRIKTSVKNESPAGDLALIYNYMKMLDPGSVVRESEFAAAASTGTYGEKIQAAAKRVVNGERLTASQRNDFLSSTDNLFNEQKSGFNSLKKKYSLIADEYGLSPERVISGFDIVDPIDNAFDDLWKQNGGN